MSSKQINQPSSKFQIAESTLEDQKKLEDILDYDAKWTVPGYMGEDSLGNNSINENLDSAAKQAEEPIAGENMNNNTRSKIVQSNKAKNTKEVAESIKIAKRPDFTKAESLCMISVGSFTDKVNALNLSKKLKKKGFKSEIKTTQTAMSRVVVLTTCSGDELSNMLNKLKNEFNPQAFIVK